MIKLNTNAIIIMFVAMSMIPASDTAGKLLSWGLGAHPIYISWSRFFISALMIIFKPISDVFAAFFIGPLVSYILVAIFLLEPVTWQRTALIILGFIGVLIVVRPGSKAGVGLLWAVAAGTCYGGFLTASRWIAHMGTPIGLTFTQLFISPLVLAPIGATNIPTLTGEVIWLTALSALFSMLTNLLLLYAYKTALATRLAPLIYFQLLAAVFLGWVFFETLPAIVTWIGLLIVMGAGITSARLRA